MGEGQGHQRWEVKGVGRYVCMNVEGPQDDVSNWDGEKHKSWSEGTVRGKPMEAIL